jgi:dihydroorotate dehydrogenase
MLDLLWKMARPALFSLDAEQAHRLTMDGLHRMPGLSRSVLGKPAEHPGLACTLAGMKLRSPVGLAAGMDKDGEAISVWPQLGFGFIEVGTVTAHPQEGNPKPRLFRLKEEGGLINRMGFNNKGSHALADRLRNLRNSGDWPDIPVGANVGKSKITPLDEAAEDYAVSIRRLHGLVDYFTVNVSSPNTPGLRELQSAERLRELLGKALPAAGGQPVFVKFAPDMEEASLLESIEIVAASGCRGIIATNTTNTRPGGTERLGESGGLSGRPLWPLSKQQIALVLDAVDLRLPVIGVGGIDGPERASELLSMGCAAVQVYSALVFQGPGLIHRINRGLGS